MNVAAIVGLGNPGEQYAATRHNVGCWMLDRLVGPAALKSERKLLGDAGIAQVAGHSLRVFRPTTYMNESGRAVRRLLDFYKLDPGQVLIMHDELDLEPGTIRLKTGGGHGGHNGLRDIISHCGRDFMRLRIGIGHPGHKSRVSGYVLSAPRPDERAAIESALPDACRAVEMLIAEGMERAMHFLHSAAAPDQG